MSQDQYATYAETMDERARREIALAWFMGWLAGATYASATLDEDDIQSARENAEQMFSTKLLAFGQSESQ